MREDIDIMGGPNLLVKLAYAVQRLKKYLKRFCHAQQRWEGQVLDFVGPYSSWGGPPTWETLPGLGRLQKSVVQTS